MPTDAAVGADPNPRWSRRTNGPKQTTVVYSQVRVLRQKFHNTEIYNTEIIKKIKIEIH